MNPITKHFSQLLSSKPYVNTTPRAGINRWVSPYVKFCAGDTLKLTIVTETLSDFDHDMTFNTKTEFDVWRNLRAIEALSEHIDKLKNGTASTWNW